MFVQGYFSRDVFPGMFLQGCCSSPSTAPTEFPGLCGRLCLHKMVQDPPLSFLIKSSGSGPSPWFIPFVSSLKALVPGIMLFSFSDSSLTSSCLWAEGKALGMHLPRIKNKKIELKARKTLLLSVLVCTNLRVAMAAVRKMRLSCAHTE